MDIQELRSKVEKINELTQEIYNYFSYKEKWDHVIIYDYTDYEWWVEDDQVFRVEKGFQYETEITGEIITMDEMTMIRTNIRTDCNPDFLEIYSNEKRKEL